MRDPDNKILGGVCSGLAAYFGWDVTAIRLIFIALIFIPYCPIVIIYLILWLITPIAHTAADKLKMRGESITVENIGKTVTDSFEQSNNKASDTADNKEKSPIHNIGDNIVSIVGFILKVLAIVIGIIALPILAIILLVLIIIAIGMIGLLTGAGNIVLGLWPFDYSLLSMLPTWLSVMACLGVILTIGIPAFSLIYAICALIFKLKPISSPIKWTLLVLWFIGLAISVISALNILNIYSYLPITTIHNVYFS
jgi:phage shock protein PspC (stress-responsive transcriptional regulator)